MIFDKRFLNQQQGELGRLIKNGQDFNGFIALCLTHHAMLHSKSIHDQNIWSYVDEILDGLDKDKMRVVSKKEGHSILWNLWHLARIEDITMNFLVGGNEEIFFHENYQGRLGIPYPDTGNETGPAEVETLSAVINWPALIDYQNEVGRQTQNIIRELKPEQIKQKIDPEKASTIRKNGSVKPQADAIIDYWFGKTVGGLILMPPTRHRIVHLNECARIRQQIG